jgi:enoyl-CoA hydratase/carnithine racemase
MNEAPLILRTDRDRIAVLTINRPRALNAMNAEAIAALGEAFGEVGADDAVAAVVLTGAGEKAFVAGADIGYLSTLKTAQAAKQMCLDFQGAIAVIENLGKPVVCAMNGLALGGGCEIAMGTHARIARAGLRVMAGQPEVALGLIPGAGGTQRLPRWVGFEVAGPMLRTGLPIPSERAAEIGLVDRLTDGDVVEEGIAFAREILDGRYTPRPIPKDPLDVPAQLPDVDIGHLSTVVDAILCRAVLEGGAMTLADGLKHEARLFGEVRMTEDAGIGIANFLENGPKVKAPFVHR